MVYSEFLEKQANEDKAFIKKNKYPSKKYNDNFRAKHAEKLAQKIECSVCKNHYTYYTKSKHMTTKKHQNAVNKTPNNTPNLPDDVVHLVV